MPKRTSDEYQKIVDDNIDNIRKIIMNQREIYNKYIIDSEMHNLVIKKVTEKLNTDVLPNDINHFQGILRSRYLESYNLLHDCSDKIKNLQKEHYKFLDKISIANSNIKKLKSR
jgi:hypothetical protein